MDSITVERYVDIEILIIMLKLLSTSILAEF